MYTLARMHGKHTHVGARAAPSDMLCASVPVIEHERILYGTVPVRMKP
jgi:hypothetical protein